MSVEIQWTDEDPRTGEKRFVRVERFAGRWNFQVRAKRREDWITLNIISRDLWETLLDAVERRYSRREGISDVDVTQLRRMIATLKPGPSDDCETATNEVEES